MPYQAARGKSASQQKRRENLVDEENRFLKLQNHQTVSTDQLQVSGLQAEAGNDDADDEDVFVRDGTETEETSRTLPPLRKKTYCCRQSLHVTKNS